MIFLIGIYISVNAQNEGVEKSMYTIQTGVLGIWLNHECKITNEISLRTEIGLDGGISVGNKTIYGLAPKIAIEPRWYYNMDKRITNGKFTNNNSANFITVGVSYISDWFAIANQKNVTAANQVTIIPKWGIRRTISKSNFNYEVGIGIGRRYFFDNKSWDSTGDLHLRIGYTL